MDVETWDALKAFDECDPKEFDTAEQLDMLHDHLLLKVDKPKDKLGNIMLPDSAKERQKSGLVLRAGPGRRDSDGALVPMTVKVGDQVFFPPNIFRELQYGGYTYQIVHEHEIIAKIRDEDEYQENYLGN